MNQETKTLHLRCSAKELNEVASGERTIITREILPANAKRYVILNEEKECTGIIPYDILMLVHEKSGSAIMAKIKKAMLMEIEDENGELMFFDYRSESFQMVDIDYHLGEIVSKTGTFPIV